MAALRNASLDELARVVVLILGVVGCGVAVWRAYLGDARGAVVALIVGVVLLLLVV